MREMMEIINSLEEAQMVAEAEGGKNTDDYRDLEEEHTDLKKILEEKMCETEEQVKGLALGCAGMGPKCAVLVLRG